MAKEIKPSSKLPSDFILKWLLKRISKLEINLIIKFFLFVLSKILILY